MIRESPRIKEFAGRREKGEAELSLMHHIAAGSWAALLQRCPRCHVGRMFRGIITMNAPCPTCGLVFEREEGYFLGSMYISYGIAAAILGLSYLAATYIFPNWNGILLAALAIVPYLPLTPLVFRYSRVLWVYFDRYDIPDGLSAGSYEDRQRKQARGEDGDASVT
jgi:uncharacterized protein (DUF983 family)